MKQGKDNMKFCMPLAPVLKKRCRTTPASAIAILITLGLLSACGGNPPRQEHPSPATEPTTDTATSPSTAVAPAALTEQQALARIKDENSIYFSLGAAQVDAAGEAKLRAHAEHLKANPKLDVVLTGHTDDRGSRSYNLAVSEQRTLAVARLLQSFGVARSRIQRISMGSERPGVRCKSAACQKKLRRVDITYRE